MKITEFLKKYSLIDNNFIDDFYSFYDEGKNEYDFTIKLELISTWLNVRKDQIKRLLEYNFSINQDYIEYKQTGLKGTGNNNTKIVLLTYTCAKLLCMISKCEKASTIRNYYIELEKLLITYKDNIVNDLNNQLGIKTTNKEIIDKNNKTGLIYVLKVEDEVHKIGNSKDIKKRMKQYNVGRINELPIVFVYKTTDIEEIESCVKNNLKKYRVKKNANNEIFKIDKEFIKDTILYCNKRNSIKLKQNIKLFNKKDNSNWLIIIDKDNDTNLNELYKMKTSKKTSIKASKKASKKSSKKTSIKAIKKASKKSSKKKA
jgi:phage anti-repressor protein